MEGDLSSVIFMLDSGDESMQAEALFVLGDMGAAVYSDMIAARLKSSSKSVKRAALWALGSLGSSASKHTSAVEGFLEDKDADLVAEACTAVGGLRGANAASQLEAKLTSPFVEVAVAACMALAAMDAGADAVKKLLSNSEPRLRAASVTALTSMTQAATFVGDAANLVGDGDCFVRVAAAEMVRAVGSTAAAHAPAIGKFLGAKEKGVQAAAAAALAGLGEGAASQAEALAKLLETKGEDISSLPLATVGVVAKVSPIYRKPACAAAVALGAIGSAGAKYARQVGELLKDRDPDIRCYSLSALGAMGMEGAKFESQVMDSLSDGMPKVVAAACGALGQFAESTSGSETTASAVAELLASPHPMVRASAAASIGLMGDAASGHMNELVKLFGDRSESVKLAAVRAVAKGGEIGQMYAACMPLYDMSSTEVRKASIEAIAGMGRRGLGFTEEVEGLLEDPVPVVRDAATKALAIFEELALADAPPPAPLGEDGEPLLPVALIFPGQGSQYVKMLEGVKDLPAVQDMLAKAQTILGYDILDLCLTGPEEKLQETKYCQPAMYIGGLAAVEQLRQDKPDMVAKCRQVAGLSLGEYTALTVAGVFDFETGLKIVKLRGEAMQEAADAPVQSMLSVAGLSQEQLEALCKESCTAPTDVCQIANFLFPAGFSCAGTQSAVETLMKKAQKQEGCLQAKLLKTTGGFHTTLMAPAKERLLAALREVEKDMKPPRCDVYMNVTGHRITPATKPSAIIPMLGEQLVSCVQWEPCMREMLRDGVTEFYECGPMKQLKSMMKRIDPAAFKATTTCDV